MRKLHATRIPLILVLPLAAFVALPADAAPVQLEPSRGVDAIVRYDGSASAPPASPSAWRQMQYAVRAADGAPSGWPSLQEIESHARGARRAGVVPIGLIDVAYERVTPGGSVRDQGRLFSAAALVSRTYRGADVTFRMDPDLVLTDGGAGLASFSIDFADGRGAVSLGLGELHRVRYRVPGVKTLALRAVDGEGGTLQATFRFEVLGLVAPTPDDTLHVTGTIPYLGGVASGDAYVYLAAGHADIVNPVVVAEGFDLDNSLDWDALYELLNREGLVETLRGEGYDLVVLDFDDATDYVQRNTYVLMELLQQVRAIAGDTDGMVLVGASMGGLCGRLALATMEDMAIPHGCRLFISFDAPQRGANIPLGVQHWVDFFSSQSADAQLLLDALNSPASRQMLVYHHSASNSAGVPDPLRAGLIGDFAAVGGYPAVPRLVAVANGSGEGADQGFAAGDRIIDWNYDTTLIDFIGNVWAVPDGGPDTVFVGDMLVPFVVNEDETIVVSGTLPWDAAPGGYRNSMAQMDSVDAPFGDIVALHPNHCFIPTISAIDLPVVDPFYDIAGEPDVAALTPFDTVYVPAENQEHVAIVAENADWLLGEIGPLTVAVRPGALAADVRFSAAPNPFRTGTRLYFDLARDARVEMSVFGVDGRRITRLVNERLPAGSYSRAWDGRDEAGRRVAPGVYLVRLERDGVAGTLRIVRLD